MKTRLPIIVLAVLALCVSSCHSSRHTVRGDRGQRGSIIEVDTGDIPRGNDSPRVSTTRQGERIISVAREWLGTPYRYGGNDRSGVDCSGMVCAVYVRAVDIKLPRSSREIAQFCQSISRRDLRPGDLVFFTSRAGGDRISHVAIYMGDNKIIHSTSSRGVIISDLDENYWRTHFKCCGHVRGVNL